MSPTILRKDGYRFFFFSKEETRKHVHVFSATGEAKFWLEPKIKLAQNYRYSSKDLNHIEKLVGEHYHEIINAWERHFGD